MRYNAGNAFFYIVNLYVFGQGNPGEWFRVLKISGSLPLMYIKKVISRFLANFRIFRFIGILVSVGKPWRSGGVVTWVGGVVQWRGHRMSGR